MCQIILKKQNNIKHKLYPVILLTAVEAIEISINSRFGHENAIQASIVASTSLQQPKRKGFKHLSGMNTKLVDAVMIWFR